MAIYTNIKTGERIQSTKNPDGTTTRVVLNAPKQSVSAEQSAPTNINQNQASKMTTQQLSQALANPISSPVPVDQLQPGTAPTLPTPTAGTANETLIGSVAGDVVKARATIDTRLANDKAAADAKIATLQQEQKDILAKGEQLSEPFRLKLENAERDRLYINKNFEDNQKLIDELDSLLTEGNNLINISKGRAVANTVLNKSVNKTISDVNARAGVIQAVMSARSGQIAEAERLIDRTVNAITADRQDEIAYYDTLLSLNNQNLLSLDAESKQIAQEQRSLAVSDLKQAEATANFVKSLMINPDTAKFMSDSGVTLNDSLETMQTKMGKEATRVEELNTANATTDVAIQSGYATEAELTQLNSLNANPLAKKELADRIIARGTREEVALKRQQVNASLASARWGNRAKMVELAMTGDPEALKALNWDPRVASAEVTEEETQQHAIKTLETTSLLDAVTRISKNEAGIKSSTGAVASAWLQGLFGGPLAGRGSKDRGAVSTALSLTPVIGNISNAAYAVNAKKDLIADVNYLVQNDTFKRYIKLKESGVTLTPFTDADARRITAAGILGSKIKFDKETNEAIGINGSEAEFKRALAEFESAMITDQDTSNTKFAKDKETQDYINKPLVLTP